MATLGVKGLTVSTKRRVTQNHSVSSKSIGCSKPSLQATNLFARTFRGILSYYF